MICQRCLRRLAHRNPVPGLSQRRAFTQTRITSTSETTEAPGSASGLSNSNPVATSTSAGHPPSASPTPKPSKHAAKLPASSVLAGTVLKGLNFMKTKQDPIALEDNEYPPWLWTVLEPKSDATDGQGVGGDDELFSKSKKQRQRAAKALRRQQLMNPESLIPKVPIYEQSIDLPAGDGTPEGARLAEAAREELTKAMRDKRRSKIKEGNFLKSMR